MITPRSPLFTDLYELTMMQGYLCAGINKREACFDLFFRKNPFKGGYAITAGLENALEFLENIRFSKEELAYLKSLRLFENSFLDYLANFRFTADVHAISEGTPVFPLEPILRVTGALDQCQLVESALLNIINFQSLIATKSARVCMEAGEKSVLEFGLRRAQGSSGALTASRAAYIGGCSATSNVMAGKVLGIPLGGTHAHSWVMSFENELEAFRNYAEVYPKNSVLLVDSYDTLKSGMPAAIKVGLEMKKRGEKLEGVRLDSGDMVDLSRKARKMLDDAGLEDSKIICSGDLDEYAIRELKAKGAKIDVYGVGTKLVTAHGDSSLSGVYKLVAVRQADGDWEMKLKISDSPEKSTLPGVKQVWRISSAKGEMIADFMELDGEKPRFSGKISGYNPLPDYDKKSYDGAESAEPLLKPVMSKGEITARQPELEEIRERARIELKKFPPAIKRLTNPEVYAVNLGRKLMEQTTSLRNKKKPVNSLALKLR